MKYLKKIASLALAVVMLMAMATTAFAAGTNTITVKNAKKSETYKVYQLLDLDVNANKTAYSYYLNDDWKAFFQTGAGKDYVDLTTSAGKTYVTWKDGKDGASDMEAFGKAAAAYATANSKSPVATQTPTANGDITFSALENGYFLITSTVGTQAIVTTTPKQSAVEVSEKNSVPDISKTVQEDSLVTRAQDGNGINGYQKQNDVDIGQTVYFKTVISAKKGATNYVLYDKMDSALTYTTGSIKVYKGSVAAANLVVASGNYTVAPTGTYMSGNGDGTATENGNATFIVTFTQSFLNTITADTDIIVLYEATLNANAVVNTGYLNDTTLKYGNNSNYTKEEETKTYTWGVEVVKYTGDNATTGTKLQGAEFVIYRVNTAGKAEYALFDANKKLTGWSAADTTTAVADLPTKDSDYFADAAVLTTGADGKINVSGLDEGSYYLLETKAPGGYNKLNAATALTITSTSGTAGGTLANALTSGTSGVTQITVANSAGNVLPETGGIGTTVFYVLGSILVLGAVVLLITRRRMNR